MMQLVSFQDFSQWKLKQFYPFITNYLSENEAIIKKGLKFEHLNCTFNGNTFGVSINPSYRHLYYKTTIPYTFPSVSEEELLTKMGLDLTYNYFQKEDLEWYLKLQGFSYNYNGKDKMVVDYNCNSFIPSIVDADSNQLMNFTDKPDNHIDVALVKSITDIKSLLPERVKRNAKRKRMGLRIDLTTRAYSIDYLKKMIDLVKDKGGQYVILNVLSDNAYVLESKILNQIANTRKREVDHQNVVTKLHFYSNNQMRSLCNYARSKNIEVIPEFSILSGVRGIDKLCAIHTVYKEKNWFDGKTGDWLVFDENVGDDVKEFIKKLIDEVNTAFVNNNDRIHCGGKGYKFEYLDQFNHIRYYNEMNIFIRSRGKIMQLWNESITKENMIALSKDIEIFYSERVGKEVVTEEERREIILLKPSFPQLIGQGFKVYNANYYYTNYTPRFISSTLDVETMTSQVLKDYDLGQWDKDDFSSRYTTLDKVYGGLVSYNNDDVITFPEDTLYLFLETYISTIITIGLLTDPKKKTFYLDEIKANNYNLCLYHSYIDYWNIAYRGQDIIYEFDFRNEKAHLITAINEFELDKVEESTVYVTGNERCRIEIDTKWSVVESIDRNEITYVKYKYYKKNHVLYISHEIDVVQREGQKE